MESLVTGEEQYAAYEGLQRYKFDGMMLPPQEFEDYESVTSSLEDAAHRDSLPRWRSEYDKPGLEISLTGQESRTLSTDARGNVR